MAGVMELEVTAATGIEDDIGGTGIAVGVTGTGIAVSAQGASTVLVQPHSFSEYVTVVVDMDVGNADAEQELVWWHAQESSQ